MIKCNKYCLRDFGEIEVLLCSAKSDQYRFQALSETPSATSSTFAHSADQQRDPFAKRLLKSLFARLIEWFGNIANGIGKFFAREVHTKIICLSDESGESTCVTKEELDALLTSADISADTANSGTMNQSLSQGGGTSAQTTTSTQQEEREISHTVDNQPPVITINGDNPAMVTAGAAYVDLGAFATDNVDRDLSVRTFVNGMPIELPTIDTSIPGTHTIEYVASDTAGNTATSSRKVIITTLESSYTVAAQPTEGHEIGIEGDTDQGSLITESEIDDGSIVDSGED